METLTKSLRKYFAFIDENFSPTWEALCVKSERIIIAIRNQSEQLQLVQKAEEEIELLKIPNLKSSLMSKIKLALEGELKLISEVMEGFSEADAELEDKYSSVVKSSEHRSCSIKACQETTCCLSYSSLVEWAGDVRNYYRGQHLQMSHVVKLIDFDDEDAINSLVMAFQEDGESKQYVKYILAKCQWFTHPVT